MTPTEIETWARQRYNAIGDTFWSQAEILNYMTGACMRAARRCGLIERTYTSTTVASQQEYDFPTNTIAIKRVTWNGIKLKPITMREDDAVTGLNMTTTATGTPQYYWVWNYTIALRPIPNDAQSLKIWSVNTPSALTITSTLEIPSQFHEDLIHYINREMALKDSNFNAAKSYGELWEQSLIEMDKWQKKRKRTDGFGTVQDEDQLVEGYFGIV